MAVNVKKTGENLTENRVNWSMNQTVNSQDGGAGPSKLKRIIWPLIWWGVFVLALIGYRALQKLLEQNRLTFITAVEGALATDIPTALLDGQPVSSGERVSLGRHRLVVSHPLAESYETNFSMWYAPRSLGVITLKRSKGVLSIRVDPPAHRLEIQGREFSLRLTNSAGVTSSVPTDTYQITTIYRHWQDSETAVVTANATNTRVINPPLGALQLACNLEDATFELLSGAKRIRLGRFPEAISGLPQGAYQLTATHHKARRQLDVNIEAGKTNALQVDFLYGSFSIETDPPGATVSTQSGESLGTTPIVFGEEQPGTVDLVLARDGYISVPLSITISANQSNSIRTNLVNASYASSLKAAKEALAAGDYDRALAAANQALGVQANDPAVTSIHNQAAGLRDIRQARALGDQKKYSDAIKALNSALRSLPDNADAKGLLDKFTKLEADRVRQLQSDKWNRPKEIFDAQVARHSGNELFETHEFATALKAKDATDAIRNAFTNVRLCKKASDQSPEDGVFQLAYSIEVAEGVRRCVVVCGDAGGGKTRVLFKVYEYSTSHHVKLEQGVVDHVELTPIDPTKDPKSAEKLRKTIADGTKEISDLIRNAINGS